MWAFSKTHYFSLLYTVSIWQGLEAYLFSMSNVKGQGQNWTLTIFPYQQPCDHSTLNILRPILTILAIQLVYDKV